MEVGALAHDEVPLAQVGKLDMFSPDFQTLVTDKGGMIMHMLRWVIGHRQLRQGHPRRRPAVRGQTDHHGTI